MEIHYNDYIDVYNDFNIIIELNNTLNLDFDTRILYKDHILVQDKIHSDELIEDRIRIKLSYSYFDSLLPILSDEIISLNSFTLGVMLTDSINGLTLFDSVVFKVKLPIFADIYSVNNNLYNVYSQYKFIDNELIYSNRFDEAKLYKINKLCYFISFKTRGVFEGWETAMKLSNIENDEGISFSIETDTGFGKYEIFQYPLYPGLGVDYNIEQLEKKILELVNTQTNSDSYLSSWLKKKDNYYLETTIYPEYSGHVGIYLLFFNDLGDYEYHQIGYYLLDTIVPVLSYDQYNNGFCIKPNDKLYQGTLCLRTEQFTGIESFRVPFIGTAYGDIDEIYIDGYKVNFNEGEEFYFKKYVALELGYNRISVKLIDKVGNVKNGYIPITLDSEPLPFNINIDN